MPNALHLFDALNARCYESLQRHDEHFMRLHLFDALKARCYAAEMGKDNIYVVASVRCTP